MSAGDLQAEAAEDLAHPVDVGRIGAVAVRELLGRDRGRPGDEALGKLGPAAGNQCHLDPFALVDRPNDLDAGKGLAFAAR